MQSGNPYRGTAFSLKVRHKPIIFAIDLYSDFLYTYSCEVLAELGPIAQLVELPAHNRLVPGSSPGRPTIPEVRGQKSEVG